MRKPTRPCKKIRQKNIARSRTAHLPERQWPTRVAHARAALVQRGFARRQPGARRADERVAEIGVVPDARENRFQGNSPVSGYGRTNYRFCTGPTPWIAPMPRFPSPSTVHSRPTSFVPPPIFPTACRTQWACPSGSKGDGSSMPSSGTGITVSYRMDSRSLTMRIRPSRSVHRRRLTARPTRERASRGH